MTPSAAVRSARSFVAVVLRQLANDRSALLFMVALPVAIIVIIGSTFGTGSSLVVGVTGGDGSQTAAAITEALDAADGVRVEHYDTADDLAGAVRRYAVSGGVVFPSGLDAAVVSGDAHIRFVADPLQPTGQLARDLFTAAAVAVLRPVDAARFGAERTAVPYDVALDAATALDAVIPTVEVGTVDLGDRQESELSAFSLTAPQNLVLFTFINAMASGAALVRMRRTGVLRRVLAGPVGAGTITLGLMAAWFVIALLQSVLILTVGALLFDVDWGDPVGAASLVVVFALVGAGAGLVVGALGGNEDRVGAISPPVGIALGALGGCMIPMEVFPPVMRDIAQVVPHYWAMSAWQQLIFDGDPASAIVGPLLVLAAFAGVFLGVAAIVLRRSLVRV